jgi:hypothetical protein
MYSLSIDYLFNRVYDVLLWMKYTWLFVMLRHDKGEYLDLVKDSEWDGLRDRGWFDGYLANKNAPVPEADTHISLWQRVIEKLGIKARDTDGDGIPDASDDAPYDADNLSTAQIKERYEADYSLWDHVRDIFGLPPKDSDHDSVPDSYEDAHGLNKNNPDSDRDGMVDGKELITGTDPLNNDSDHDKVLDGRDEAPLDSSISSIGPDSDHDGVSDAMENTLGTDIHTIDTDADGIPDGMDTYPLDPHNLDQGILTTLTHNGENVIFSIQNPFLAFLSDMLSIAALAIILVLVYGALRWFLSMLYAFHHYDHHFQSDHGTSHGKEYHVVKHVEESMPAGIPGLAVAENIPTTPPAKEEYEEHPKFAIIKGYLSSDSEALWRIGIMEADNLLGEALREKGYQGDGVGEMLKNASFKTVQLAWDAHKVRNRIAHDGSSFELTSHEAKRVLGLYESVLRELKVV